MDMTKIMNYQRHFQTNLGNDITKQEFRNKMFLGLIEETVEAMKATPHKAHSSKQKMHRTMLVSELVDIQIYLTNLLISVDCSEEEFNLKVMKKIEKNFDRQKKGY